MNKICKNCQSTFTIEPDDFGFYEKIKVPPPTFCSDCRMQRRFSWRNERTLHRNTCAITGQSIISSFSADSGMVVYNRDYWWSDAWEPTSFGQDYDFSKSFFQQYQELMHRVPFPAVFNARTTNCDYSNHTGESKNGYLISASWNVEDCAYCSQCGFSKDFFDCYGVYNSELCYEDVTSMRIAKTFFSQHAENCTDSAFLYDCKNCIDCFGCVNLRNKKYCIWNEQYSKEEYHAKLKELDLGSFKNLEIVKAKFEALKKSAIRKYAHQINCANTTGDNVANLSNCSSCFNLSGDVRNSKWCMNGGFHLDDAYDGYGIGEHAELLYESVDTGVQAQRLAFCIVTWGGNDLQYMYNCFGCQNCFGCIGLRNKQYCILNKQYTKEEYEQLVEKIKIKMTSDGEFGEFFPTAISPFGYNETIAQDYFSLTKEQALAKGYKWRDPEISQHQPTVKANDLADHIKDVDDSVLKEIIECVGCHKPYRFIKKELDFLKRFNIALPRKCFECRHQDRFHQVNFPRLYHRTCMKEGCENEFETSYSPDRPEAVYCESCYQAEVI